MLRIILIILSLSIVPGTASWAAKVNDLVVEKSEQEYGLEMPANGHFDIRTPEGTPSEADYIADFWMDRASGRFAAIVVKSDGSTSRIDGAAVLTIPVPVVTRQMLPDEIITKTDLAVVDMPQARIGGFTVTDKQQLLGMQVRRVLARGRPIQRQSITPPVVIARGARVTIEVKSGSLFLSAQGKALSDAFLGQNVRVVNLNSNKTVQGIARSNGIVEVSK